MSKKSKWSGRFLAGHILLTATCAVHIAVLLLSIRVSFFPGADVLRTIVTTCAQIIAGLYGITVAGYTFFLSRIDGLTAQDTTLDYIVASLKNRYKHLMWFLTGNVLTTLLVSIFLLYLPAPTSADHAFYYRFFCNEFIVSLGCSILFILYYCISVVNPKSITNEAKRLKKRLSRSILPKGDISRFLILFDRIERSCCALIDPIVLEQLRQKKGFRFDLVIELLQLNKSLPLPLLRDIRRIYRYYACTLNSSPMTVSREMTELAQQVSEALSTKTP